MASAFHSPRAQGTGTIRRAAGRIGWVAFSPKETSEPRGKYLGRFDTYRQAERAIEKFILASKVA